MKKTVGMITFYRDNYGAFLQAYALQQILIKLNFQPELIRYEYENEGCIMRVPLSDIREPVAFFKRVAVRLLKYPWHQARRNAFRKSINEYLVESKRRYTSYGELSRNVPYYDVYLTGSDQMFNPTLSPQSRDARALCFVGDEKRKFAYAASCGYSSIPDEFKEYYKRVLCNYEKISVRESSFQLSLGELLGREVEHCIDPSLLLSSTEWRRIAKFPVSGNYIFFYHAGMQEGLIESVEEISKELNMPVFVADKDCKVHNQIPRKGYLRPEEWVGALIGASYVVTNSFHGTAFSVNFHKRAYVIVNGNRSERMLDLLKNCGLERLLDRRIISDSEVYDLFNVADKYLENERDKGIRFLSSVCGQ